MYALKMILHSGSIAVFSLNGVFAYETFHRVCFILFFEPDPDRSGYSSFCPVHINLFQTCFEKNEFMGI